MLRFPALLLWLMMVAVPFQGYAAAAMAFCAPAQGHVVHEVHEAHEVMLRSGVSQADPHDHHHGQAPHASDAGSPAQHDTAAQGDLTHKCGTCAACHAFALTPCAAAVVLDDLPAADLADPSAFVAAVSPRTPDKPPRA